MQPALWAGAGAAATALFGTAAYAYWRHALGRPPAELPAVLAYHKVGTPELGGTWCTRRQFAAHLDDLLTHGFRGIDARDFEERVRRLSAGELTAAGELPAAGAAHMQPAHAAPGRTQPGDTPPTPTAAVSAQPTPREFLISFDDAYASFAEHAFPELQARGIPALLFVISDYAGRAAGWDLPLPGRRVAHLDWQALRDLCAAGIEIGSHTRTHRDLCRLADDELRDELYASKLRLEDRIGHEVRTVSYPFGRYDERVLAAAAAAGYTLGFSMCPRTSNARVEPLALRRWGVYVIDSSRSVRTKVDPTSQAFWIQDLLTRAINAVASVSAAASVRHHSAG